MDAATTLEQKLFKVTDSLLALTRKQLERETFNAQKIECIVNLDNSQKTQLIKWAQNNANLLAMCYLQSIII